MAATAKKGHKARGKMRWVNNMVNKCLPWCGDMMKSWVARNLT